MEKHTVEGNAAPSDAASIQSLGSLIRNLGWDVWARSDYPHDQFDRFLAISHKADRLAAEVLRLRAERDAMEKGHARYEFIRTLAPVYYAQLWNRNIRGEGPFDELVDVFFAIDAALSPATSTGSEVGE